MAGLEALIFDVDGTLADTERDGHRVAFNRAFRVAGLGWDWTPELYGRLLQVTGGKERIRYYLEAFAEGFQPPADQAGWIAELHRAKTRHYLEIVGTGQLPLRPGVERLLDEARAHGLILAIATTTTPDNVLMLLETSLGCDAIGHFPVIAAGDVVAAKKPAPDIYEYALRRLGLPPEACLAIEDSDKGLQSSLAAGIRTLVTVNDYTRDQDFSGAALVLDHLGEPGRPFTVLAGEAPAPSGLVDVAMLRALHRQERKN